MEYQAPHTVDVSAQQQTIPESNGKGPNPPPPESFRSIVVQTLALDGVLLIAGLLLAALSGGAVGSIVLPAQVSRWQYLPPVWLLVGLCAGVPLVFMLLDVARAVSRPASLPMARTRAGAKAIYARRIHMMLLALYFSAILVGLCWSAFSMPLVSKMFVGGIFAIALYALGRSIPSRRLSFLVSGILFLVVLFTTQAFIVLKLESDSVKANEELLNGLEPPEEEMSAEERERLLESRGE